METTSTDQTKCSAKKCQIEGCSEVTVGCRTLLCRRHRNTKYKQNYKKKKRKAQGIEEKQKECHESQLAEEKYLLERQYASMLQQVLIQKRLEVLNTGSVIQLLRNHQQKVREKKEKEMEEKRKEAQLRSQPTQQQNVVISTHPVASVTNATLRERPATTTGSVTGTEGMQKAELSFTPSQRPSTIPANQINTLANIVRSISSKSKNGVPPMVNNTAMPVSKNTGTLVHSRNAHDTRVHVSPPSLMPRTSSDSGIALSYGTAFTSGNFSMPAGNLAIVQLPGNSGITVSTGNMGVLQTSVNSGLAMPSATTFFSCTVPAVNAAIVRKDTSKVMPTGNLGFIETSKKYGGVQALGSSDIVVWARKDGIPQTSRNPGVALPTGNARILPASTSSGMTVPTRNPGVGQISGARNAINNGWMTQALECSAKAPGTRNYVAGSMVTSYTQPVPLAVGSFSPERSAADRLRLQSSPARGALRASPHAAPAGVRQVRGASNQRGASANRRILPHNSANACNGGAVLNSKTCAEGVRQVSLASGKAAVSRPLSGSSLRPAHGSQTGRQRLATPTGYLRPTQRILPNQPSISTATNMRQDNGSARVLCGTQIRAPGLMPCYIQTPVSMAGLSVQQTGRLSAGNPVAQQQNFSGCVSRGQQLGVVNYPATSVTHITPQTVNHLLAGVSAGPTMAPQGVVSDVWLSQMPTGGSSIQTENIPSQEELLFQTLQVTKDTGLPMRTVQPQNPANSTLDQLMAEGPWALSIGL